MNDQSGSAISSINAFTSYPLSLRMVESNTAPSRGMGNLTEDMQAGEPASINEILGLNYAVPLLYYELRRIIVLMKNNDFPGLEYIVETIREPLLVLDANLNILSANRSFCNIFKGTEGETIGHIKI